MARPFALATSLAIALGAVVTAAHADSPPPEAASLPPLCKLIFHPEGPGTGRASVTVGIMWDYPPQRVVEGQISAFPQLESNLRIGLPLHFGIVARLQTAIVTNEAIVGFTWSHVFDDIPGSPSISVRLLGGSSFGGLVGFGYDAFLYAFLVRPGVALGWRWRSREIAFTLRQDFVLSAAQFGIFGGSNVKTADGRIVGSESALIIENPVHGGGNWYFGAALMIARASYALWLPFTADEAFVAYPRFFAGHGF
ncbi:hypothetical protein BH09MYX1_BH09MYX1_51360 [soil metagenome]